MEINDDISLYLTLHYYWVLFLSDYLIFIVALLFLYFAKRDRGLLMKGLFSVALALLITEITKYFFPVSRPEESFLALKEGARFPSTHTAISFAFAFTTLYFSKKKGALLLTLALFVSLGRILAGAHLLIDIIAGILVGFIVSFILSKFKISISLAKK